jgi:hypothetical protein
MAKQKQYVVVETIPPNERAKRRAYRVGETVTPSDATAAAFEKLADEGYLAPAEIVPNPGEMVAEKSAALASAREDGLKARQPKK